MGRRTKRGSLSGVFTGEMSRGATAREVNARCEVTVNEEAGETLLVVGALTEPPGWRSLRLRSREVRRAADWVQRQMEAVQRAEAYRARPVTPIPKPGGPAVKATAGRQVCPDCEGSGVVERESMGAVTCPLCDGQGWI